jgi:putative transport protein
METLAAFLASQPLLALFLVIGLGYALGEVSLGGLSLGVGAVLFVGLALGALVPGAAPPPLLGLLGLVMFLYGIGIQYGRQFVAGLTGAAGRRANLLALLGLAAGVATALAAIFGGVPVAYVTGLFAGAMTSTAALQAAIEISGTKDPAVGYSVAYPIGVIGPILCMYVFQLLLRPKVEAPGLQGLPFAEIAIRNPEVAGRTFAELATRLPAGVMVTAIRQQHRNLVPCHDLVLSDDDVLLVEAETPALLETARRMLGDLVPMRMVKDRADLDYLRVFVSRKGVVGLQLAALTIPGGVGHSVVHLRRGDTELLPRPDLILEFGDRVGLLCPREQHGAVRSYFGDSIRGTAEFSYVSVGIGMALGVIVGLLPVPIPGIGTVRLGTAGGPLLVALLLGYLGRTAGIVWTMPASANLTLRNFGLTLFLAQVGMSSGPKFVATVQETGLLFLAWGAAILLAVVLVTLLVGHALKIAYDDLLGIASGVTGNPAILAYASRSVATDRPDLGYALIFPGATLVKILIVDVLTVLFLR